MKYKLTTRRDVLRQLTLFGASLGLNPAQSNSAPHRSAAKRQSSWVVHTSNGRVRGYMAGNVVIFKGIPYGASPTGKNRFLPPRPAPSWPGTFDARALGPMATQVRIPTSGATSEVAKLFEGDIPDYSTEPMSEDCLVLNVWTPVLTEVSKRPVMFWCHGGGFDSFSSGSTWNDGSHLARKHNVVVVSMNHRLNVFGYLYLADLGGDRYRDSGNVGMLDIVAALEWVRDNIAAFSGDPDNVTIFGESGGGCKVNVLLAMPSARKLFHQAVVQSGSMDPVVSREEATRDAHRLLGHLDIRVDQLHRLEALSPARLCHAYADLIRSTAPHLGAYHRLFWPVVDGRVIPSHPFDPEAMERSADVPMIIGTTGEEARTLLGLDPTAFLLTDAALLERLEVLGVDADQADYVISAYKATRPRATASDIFFAIASDIQLRMDAIIQGERRSLLGRAPVYMYLFDWKAPSFGGKYGSGHGFELPFVFDVLDNAPGLWNSPVDWRGYRLAASMSSAWASFAATSVPDHPSVPQWRPYAVEDRITMLFDYETRIVRDPRSEDRIAMQKIRSTNRRLP